jgi:hypothetical protein
LYVNDLILNDSFIIFLKSITRYVYFQGSTTTVKFEIYNIIKQTSKGQVIDEYFQTDIRMGYFNYLGRLKKGFALLAFYLNEDKSLSTYNVDKIINWKDEKFLLEDWESVNLAEVIDSLGNFLIIDMPKKEITINRKSDYLSHSKIVSIKNLFKNGIVTYTEFLERDTNLKKILHTFFSK